MVENLTLYNKFTNFNADIHLILKDVKSLPPRLNCLILRDSDLTDDDMQQLARLLKGIKLETLDIRGNPDITSVGLEALHNALAYHDTPVEVLLPDSLENHEFGNTSSVAIATAMKRSRKDPSSSSTASTAVPVTADKEEVEQTHLVKKKARKAEEDDDEDNGAQQLVVSILKISIIKKAV